MIRRREAKAWKKVWFGREHVEALTRNSELGDETRKSRK